MTPEFNRIYCKFRKTNNIYPVGTNFNQEKKKQQYKIELYLYIDMAGNIKGK